MPKSQNSKGEQNISFLYLHSHHFPKCLEFPSSADKPSLILQDISSRSCTSPPKSCCTPPFMPCSKWLPPLLPSCPAHATVMVLTTLSPPEGRDPCPVPSIMGFCLFVCLFLAAPCPCRTSLTRDRTRAVEAQSLNRWTTREASSSFFN